MSDNIDKAYEAAREAYLRSCSGGGTADTVSDILTAFLKHYRTPAPEGVVELERAKTEVAAALAFLGRGPGGTNNDDPKKWAEMCIVISRNLRIADEVIDDALEAYKVIYGENNVRNA